MPVTEDDRCVPGRDFRHVHAESARIEQDYKFEFADDHLKGNAGIDEYPQENSRERQE